VQSAVYIGQSGHLMSADEHGDIASGLRLTMRDGCEYNLQLENAVSGDWDQQLQKAIQAEERARQSAVAVLLALARAWSPESAKWKALQDQLSTRSQDGWIEGVYASIDWVALIERDAADAEPGEGAE
jgi:2-polyprenyl-6-methoxyphenol hydroxylase-like FAD-dependent oxidoreductase